ncbi:malto-oligosyltrehalose synthase [Desulfoscipio gibsoniae]
MAEQHIPTAAYRLQFNKQYGFPRAEELVPYLHALGVTDLYASPLLKAKENSPHGYDVADPTQLNPELGGANSFNDLVDALRRFGMGLLLDIVPNHMAAGSDNPWWQDVLQYGPDSPYSAYFDIDWQPDRPGLINKVLLPILDSFYSEVLEKGELAVGIAEDGFGVHYRERRLPLSPQSYFTILNHEAGEPASGINPTAYTPAAGERNRITEPDTQAADALIPSMGPKHPAGKQWPELLAALRSLSQRGEQSFTSAFKQIKEKLWQLYNNEPAVRSYIDDKLRILNGQRGDPASFNLLDRLLSKQFYRLAFWQIANREINYRRFFNVSDLISLRAEDERVFAATHALILQLAKAGQVTGLRIDHIDGLRNPLAYLQRLQRHLTGTADRPGFYIVAEKILSGKEELPGDWPVFGTTGYDFLKYLNQLFVNSHGIKILDDIYNRLHGAEAKFTKIVYARKRRVMTELFGSEVRSLTRHLGRLAEHDRYGRDITLHRLEQALIEVTACFPVYRTYTRDYTVHPRDKAYIEQAVTTAMRLHRAVGPACVFLRRVLLLDFQSHPPEEQHPAWLEFVMRWQQFSGPIMAKGLEDTAMYIYNRLVSQNEVGGEPHTSGITVDQFHRFNRNRRMHRPHTMNTTSTHDTKRSEDVRARINILSEIPAIWAEHLERWRRWNRDRKPALNGQLLPDANMELLIYQTLVGAWPLQEQYIAGFKKRIQDYIVKSAREAKIYTRWLEPDTEYEKALLDFVTAILEPTAENRFLSDFLRLQNVVACYGAMAGLAQVLLKITCPGVPDIYQGMEVWNFSLVDPDNRRPVNYQEQTEMLIELQQREAFDLPGLTRELLNTWPDGRVKLFVTYRALHFRRNSRQVFAAGEYIPVTAVADPQFEHLCAFARRYKDTWVLVAVPRLPAGFHLKNDRSKTRDSLLSGLSKATLLPDKELWEDRALALPEQAPRKWRNIFTGEILLTGRETPSTTDNQPSMGQALPLADVFQNFPVALLEGIR